MFAQYNWWEKDQPEFEGQDESYIEGCRANSLIEHARALDETQAEVHRQNLFNYQLYCNRYLSAFDWGTGALTATSLAPVSQTTDNVVLEVCDAVMAEVGKARPKAKPICHGASWKVRRQAKKLDKFLYGDFVRNDVYESIGKPVLLNSEVCGFGAARVEMKEDDTTGAYTCIESVFPDDILVDQQEIVATKKIWHLLYRRVLPVSVVAKTWNIPEEEVKQISTSSSVYSSYRTIGEDYVVVVEGWQANGRHVTAIRDRILEDEEWPHDWFPFVFFHYSRPIQGFYSQSLVEVILPDQIRLNEINAVIEEAQEIMCGPRLLVQQGSKVNPQALDNIIGKVVYYTGNEPKAVTWPAVAAELYQERDRRKSNAFTKVGLNQATASGNLPDAARLDSSPAIRELHQTQDGRLSDLTQRYEKFFLDLAKTMVRVIRASGKTPSTVWYSGGKKARAEKIEWSEIDLDDTAYTMILEAASSFAMTPSALRDDLESQLQQGLITPEQYRKELASPDMESENNILSAAAENLDIDQERLEEGEVIHPTPEQDLVNGVKRMTLAYLNLSRYEDVPVEVEEAFINWIEEAKMWLQKASEPAPEQSVAPSSSMIPPAAPQIGPAGPMQSPAPMMPGALPAPGLM